MGEYVLGIVPPGTHEWDKFVTPSELKEQFENCGFNQLSVKGLLYKPWIPPYWSISNVTEVNYMASFKRKDRKD